MSERNDIPVWKKLGWFVLFWLAGVGGVLLLASFLKLAMGSFAA